MTSSQPMGNSPTEECLFPPSDTMGGCETTPSSLRNLCRGWSRWGFRRVWGDAIHGMSLRAAKTATGVDHTTIAAILHGTVWPDLHTIARLEHGLAANLWPTGAAAATATTEDRPRGTQGSTIHRRHLWCVHVDHRA